MSENKFVPGLLVKAPRDGSPSFIKSSVSIKLGEFISFLEGLPNDQEWLNIDIKESRGGKLYAAINDWKPNGGGSARQGGQQQRQRPQQAASNPVDDFDSDSIPFISSRGQW